MNHSNFTSIWEKIGLAKSGNGGGGGGGSALSDGQIGGIGGGGSVRGGGGSGGGGIIGIGGGGSATQFEIDEESLKEMGENDLFALEVGLML